MPTRGRSKTATSVRPTAASAPIRLGLSTIAGREERLAGRDVGAAPADVLPRVDRREDADLAGAAFLGFLDHHDGVGAVGQRRAGRDLDALAARDALARRPGP